MICRESSTSRSSPVSKQKPIIQYSSQGALETVFRGRPDLRVLGRWRREAFEFRANAEKLIRRTNGAHLIFLGSLIDNVFDLCPTRTSGVIILDFGFVDLLYLSFSVRCFIFFFLVLSEIFTYIRA